MEKGHRSNSSFNHFASSMLFGLVFMSAIVTGCGGSGVDATEPRKAATDEQASTSDTGSADANEATLSVTSTPLLDAPQETRGGGVLNLAITPPNPVWGQRIQITIIAALNGRPATKMPIQCWWSGQKGIQSGICTKQSDKTGRITFTATIPNWKNKSGWVDFNAAANRLPAYGMWRVKG